ncbi:DNA-binding transcriptional LysR family regulator [Paraburkholderia sp. GAS199]|uniref:LysR family transcriptional regulator n=1 Tax=Paraburkholderia sp. GAS199 TaxID=3035126 RepID=UPI003D20BE43
MKLDIESLRIFVAVIEEGSIAAAAARTHLVASAVSKRISDLEDGTGTSLLYRHSRGVQPTAAGEALYHHAKRLGQYLQQISDEMSDYSAGLIGHARIYVNLTAMVQYLPNVLGSFLRANPKVQIELFEKSSDEVVRAVASGVADLGICSADEESIGDLQCQHYSTDKLVVVVPVDHPLAQKQKADFADFLDDDIVTMPYGSSISKLCRTAAEQAGKRLRVRVEVTSFEVIRNMVSAGLGIGVLPHDSVKPYVLSESFRVIELNDAWSFRPLVIVSRNFELLPVPARMLVDHIRTYSADGSA